MVTGAKSSCYILPGEQPEAKAVTSSLMFLCVVLQVLPEMVGERVFFQHSRFKDSPELRAFSREFGKCEVTPRLEPYQKDTLPVLRYDVPGINDLVINRITKCLCQGLIDNVKSVSFIVVLEMLHVLKNESGRLVVVKNISNGKEKVTLFLVLKAVLEAEA